MRCPECNSEMQRNGIVWTCPSCIEALKRNNHNHIKLERSYLGISKSRIGKSKVVIG